jgi:hypothetical protein
MCVLAAYLGDAPAAPILIEMLRREEGLGGGYYTGVATIHEGRLHYAKVVGDTGALCEQTDALSLPGTLGIAHSRTRSGGGREWAHPFIGQAERVAYVANGAHGLFTGKVDQVATGNALLDRGYRFRSASPEPIPPYPVLRDGSSIHVSEAMALWIEENLRSGMDLLAAGCRTFQDWPSEVIGLTISADYPDQFVALRINQPLTIGRSERAVYAATTALAFPEGTLWQMAMPPNTGAAVSADGMRLQPFSPPPVQAATYPPADEVGEALMGALREGPCGLGALCKRTQELWPDGRMPQASMLVYEFLTALVKAGRATLVEERVPGVTEGLTAPRTQVVLTEGR